MMFKILGGSALRIAFGIMVLAVLLLAGGAGAVTEISTCGTISSPGEYALTQSIVSSADNYCINITSSDVIFDGAGYTIDAIAGVSYPPSTYGIYVYSQTTALTNVTVKNLNVTDWRYGIYYQNAQNGTVENILLANNSNGITLIGDSNSNNLSSNILSNDGNGITISFSSSNRLTGNAVSDNTNGISLSSSNYNNLTGNAVSNNSRGISLYYSDNNDLIGNTVSNSNVGVAFTSSSNNDLSGNTASDNDIGIEIMFSSNDNNLTGNTALNNTGGGISVYLSSNNNLTNNNVLNNNMDSINLENSNNNLISGNNVSHNGNIDKALCCNFSFSVLNIGGILVYYSDGNRLFGNNVSYNAHGDITAEHPWVPVNKGGIILTYSTNTTLNDSIALNNSNFSIYLDGSENNTIYNNVFNNTNNAFDNGNNTWNTTRQPGTNIIGGSYLGGNFWSDYTGSDADGDRLGDTLIPYNSGFIQNGGDFLPLTLALGVIQNVNGGDTVTTDINNIGTSPSNPVITQVTSPIGGTVTIQESPTTQTAPGGFSFLSQEVNISAPPATPLSPLKIVFTVNSTQLGGRDQNTIKIFKNGNQVGECPGSTVANPDPCISARATLANGDVQITVLSSNGDPWNIAIPITSTAITSSAIASSSNPSLFGQSVTFTATVTANSPASEMPTGTVNFIDSGVTIGTGTLNATGQAIFSTSSLSVGPHELTAVYGGDGSFASSASPVLTQIVIYSFAGFFQPVDNLPLWNSVKAGSAVPVKFSLGGNRGLNIFATGYPASQTIDCDSSAPTDTIEETITAGSSGLSYNATTDQYVYIWKTDKAWAGTCHQLDVKLNDGTDHRANINLLK